MELLRINSSKLKITLTADEREQYGIRESGGDFDTRAVREVVADILLDAGADGFCKPREKLLVQIYPTRSGGAELFITKLSQLGDREQRVIESSESLTTYARDVASFLFDSFADLLAASRLPQLLKKRSDLYLRPDEKYMLVIDEERLGGVSDCDIISEFATRLTAAQGRPQPEWDKLLRENDAIERLSRL